MKTRDKSQKDKIVIVSILICGVCFLTLYFHQFRNIHTIFTHLFYVPIILASLWWQRKGLCVAVFFAIFLIVSNLLSIGPTSIYDFDDFLRAPLFVVIGAVVSMLSERIAKNKKEVQKERDKLQDARTRVRKLSGILPICASCKKNTR